jgi:hypothetical protein
MLGDIALILIGFFIMVTSIYFPLIDSCDGYCCSSSSSSRQKDVADVGIPYKVTPHAQPLNKYTRQLDKDAVTPKAVMVLENFFSGLSTLSIAHHPIYNMARIAAEAKLNNAYDDKSGYTSMNKNKFPIVAISGKKGTSDEIYYTAVVSQALAKPNASIVINGMTSESPAFEAWSRLVRDGLIHWKTEDLFNHETETWAKGTYKTINVNTSVSEYIVTVITDYLKPVIVDESSTIYYTISKEREDELRVAYKNDKKVTVNNVTGVYHATVLKVLYPTINVTIESCANADEEAVFTKAVEFLNTYILV